MKGFLVFSFLFLPLVSAYVAPGEISQEIFEENQRIASGVASKKGENLDFCYLSINFYQKQQTCGCFILTKDWVITSARCVVDCSEQMATNITVTFPFKPKSDSTRKVRSLYVPDGVNGEAILPKYDETMEVPLTKFHAGSNVAVIRLEKSIVIDEKTAKRGRIPAETSVAELLARASTKNNKFRACGIGAIGNKGQRAKGVMCTDVNVIDGATGQCTNPSDPTEVYEVPESFACIQWKNKDNNLCVGDYGGPIWVYELDSKGVAMNQDAFCITIGSPDTRPNAPCLDGHTVYCQFITDPIYFWTLKFYGAP